jgi:hypothetical protein
VLGCRGQRPRVKITLLYRDTKNTFYVGMKCLNICKHHPHVLQVQFSTLTREGEREREHILYAGAGIK